MMAAKKWVLDFIAQYYQMATSGGSCRKKQSASSITHLYGWGWPTPALKTGELLTPGRRN